MISAIVLAAGKSLRMGAENKMLLPYKESTIIDSVINALNQSQVGEIIIVENKEAGIAEHLVGNLKTKTVINLVANSGLTSSIQCGIKAASSNANGYLICLGDMPMLTDIDYNTLISKFLEFNNKVILIPQFNNKRGNPVLFSSHFKDEILLLSDKNGCKPVVLANIDSVIEVPFLNDNCHLDIDTLEDYRKLTK